MWLDIQGSPITESAHLTERLKRPTFGLMTVEIAVNDPKAYTRPWAVTIEMAYQADTQMLDEICLDTMLSRLSALPAVAAVAFVVALAFAPGAWSHHSQSEFDFKLVVEVEGKVTQLD